MRDAAVEGSPRSYERLVLTGARSVGLPLARAARAQISAPVQGTPHQRPREHAFGEDRGRAGEAEHPRKTTWRRCPNARAPACAR
jgi:hypothetical protein